MRLRQVSLITSFKSKFELLSKRIHGIFEQNKLNYFFSELHDEIRLPIIMLNPPTLNDAFGLAKIQKQYILSFIRSLKPSYVESHSPQFNPNMTKATFIDSILGTPTPSPSANYPIKKRSYAY